MDWINCFSTERLGDQAQQESIRSAFERDYDRIIFSSAFRRLQNKTQVFPLPEAIFVHNRLTHSLEVVSVGRSLGKMVGDFLARLPEVKTHERALDFYSNQLKNVISAACLAHDLGNPAFGHSGEEAISKYFLDRAHDNSFTGRFSQEEWQDLTNFEGNANALRILTHQFNGRLKGGYRLTITTLAAILKYPCESTATIKKGPKHRSKYGFFQTERAEFLRIAKALGMQQDGEKPLSFFRHPFVYLVEAADDICYSIIDFEDAHRLGILSYAAVEEILLSVVALRPGEDMARVKQNLKGLSKDPNEAVAYLRAKSINCLTECCAAVFEEQHEAILSGAFQGALLTSNPKVKAVLDNISAVSVEKIYGYQSVLKIELAGFKIMSGLIEDFVEAALLPAEERKSRHKKILKLLPYQNRFDEAASDYEKIMCLLDHISAMTDNYALETYRNLRGISMPAF
jgi:dGTPase